MSISENVQRRMVEGSAIRRMFEEGNILKKRYGEDKVFDLSIGNPIIEPPAEFKTELKRLADSPIAGMHRYMENAGYTETRCAVANQLSKENNCKFTLDDIVMTSGAAGAINVVLKTLLNPGEEVIVFSPYFLEFDNYIDNHGGITKVVPTDDKFIPDLNVLEQSVTAKTKAVIINSPNNPTGVVYSAEFINLLGKLLKKKEKEYSTTIFLISDEAYRKIIYDGLIYPQVFHHYTQSIVAYSHSKDLALPGERIGFIAIHPDCIHHNELIGGFIFCNRVLGFVNAPALMQHIIRNLQGITVPISEYQKKRDFLYSRLSEAGYSVVKPQGAFYMFPKSPLKDEMVFIKELMEHNILVVPGRSFGTPGYFRIAYCVNDKTLEGCVAGFRTIAQKHKLC
jgi:aspartate aminotransferase